MTKTGTTTYKHSKTFYNKKYEEYVKLYNEAQSATAAKGYNMLSPKKSRNAFEGAYKIYQENAAREGAYSKGIVNEMVRDQTLGLKRNNAAAFARATYSLPTAKRLSIEQVQHMTHEELTRIYNNELSQAYYDAMAGGKDSTNAKLWVSQHWFGSK